MALTEAEELELLELEELEAMAGAATGVAAPRGDIPGGRTESFRSVEDEPSLARQIVGGAKALLVGPFTKPKSAIKGATEGLAESTPGIHLARSIVLPHIPEGRSPVDVATENVEQNKSPLSGMGDVVAHTYRKLLSPPQPPQDPVEGTYRAVGEMGSRMAQGMAAGGAVQGTGLVPAITSGAMANVPFLEKPIAEGDWEAAGWDMLANTLFDVALYGGGKIIKGLGSATESTGKTWLQSDLKIPKTLAKRVDSNVRIAKKRIVNTLSKYDLESATGNFDTLSDRAKALWLKKSGEADALVKAYVTNNPGDKVSVVDLYSSVRDKLMGPNSPLADDELAGVDALLNKIIEGQTQRGLIPDDGMVDAWQLVEIKRSLKKGKDLFKRAKGQVAADPFKVDVYRAAFDDVIDRIDQMVPDARALNLEARDIHFVQDAADEAASRMANRSEGPGRGMGGIIGGGGVTAAAGIGYLSQSPEAVIGTLVLTGGLLTLRRAGMQGRAGSALLKTGKIAKRSGGAISDVAPGLGRLRKGAPDATPPAAGTDIDAMFYGGKPDMEAGFAGATRVTPVEKATAKISPAQTVEQFEDQQEWIKGLRSELWKDITSKTDRDILSGRKLRNAKGELLNLSDNAKRRLQKAVDSMNENPDYMMDIGVEPPEHIDDIRGWLQQPNNQGSAATQMLGLTGAGAGGALTLGAAARAGGRMKEQEQKPTQGPSGLRLDMESAQRLQDLISGLTEEELRKVYPLLQKQGY